MLTTSFEWSRLLRPEIVWVPVAIVAMLVWGVVSIVKLNHRHKERIAMIEHGMDPDDPSRQQESPHED